MHPHRICVAGWYNPEKELDIELGKIMAANRSTYCKRHGYSMFIATRRLIPEQPEIFEKFAWLKLLVESGQFDWIFWTGKFAMIVEPAIRLETIIGKKATNKSKKPTVIATAAPSYCEQFFVRCTTRSQEILHVACAKAKGYDTDEALFAWLQGHKRWRKFFSTTDPVHFSSFSVGLPGKRWKPGTLVVDFSRLKSPKMALKVMRLCLGSECASKTLRTKYRVFSLLCLVFGVAGPLAVFFLSRNKVSGAIFATVTASIILALYFGLCCRYI